MAEVVGLLRGYYVPQFVLGGLTRAVGPVILRYATTGASNIFSKQDTSTTFPNSADVPAGTPLLAEGSNVQFPPSSMLDIQRLASTIAPTTSVYLSFSIQAVCPLEHDEVPSPFSRIVRQHTTMVSISFPFLAMQVMCPLDPLDPNATLEMPPSWLDIQRSAFMKAPTSVYLPFSIQAICPLEDPPTFSRVVRPAAKVSPSFPFLALQTMCPLDLVPLDSNATLEVPPTWFDTQRSTSTIAPTTSAYLRFQSICLEYEAPPTSSRVVQTGTQHPHFATKVSISSPFLAMQVMCPLDLVSLDPNANATLAPAPVSSVFPAHASVSQTIGSYLFLPIFLSQLFVVCIVAVIVTNMDWWRSGSTRLPNKDLPEVDQPTRPKLRRKPSDAPNWRVPRNNTLHSGTTQTTTTAITPQTKLDPAHDARQAQPVALAAATLTYATYVPPHKRRASVDFGTRRPLAEVGNSFANGRGTALSSKTPTQTAPGLRRRSSTPFVQPPAPQSASHTLHHRASFPNRLAAKNRPSNRRDGTPFDLD
ncbi:hypothetical protein B0H17DRAFT_182162 [Mycena rosella]|uniref:Uncharacterized protein n=1 Tax=Mycena rosella TaxID=1033263 RepID=A0AAD7D0I8_MYCRO|nr:hypothetical protein B0H17DRAFT_182162 [Mycena rosella]